MDKRTQAIIIVPLVVALLTSVFTGLGYLVLYVVHIPIHFNWSLEIRALGLLLIVFGLLFAGWLFRYRGPATFFVSTYETMRRAVQGKSGHQTMLRTEPLILNGPHRHVRHPMYCAVVVQLLGWWLVLDYTLILLLAIFFFLWFTLFVIRYEELELRALFGEDYEKYARVVPMIFPSPRPRWPAKGKVE